MSIIYDTIPILQKNIYKIVSKYLTKNYQN